jgi:hypothetical protein
VSAKYDDRRAPEPERKFLGQLGAGEPSDPIGAEEPAHRMEGY